MTDGRPALRDATLPVPAVLPPAGRRLQPPITVLTLVAFAALATVGVSLWHTLTVRTSGGTTRRQDNEAPAEPCVLSDCLARLKRVIKMLARLPAAGLPVAQAGVGSCHLGAQNPVSSWGAVARYSGLPSLPTRSLGANTAGVTPCKNAVALVMGEMQLQEAD